MSRSFGGTRLTTRSPMTISPLVISSSPAIMRRSVDLPQPDGPTSTQNSPSAIATSTPRMTCVDPNHFSTLLMVTAAICSARLSGTPGDDVVGLAAGKPANDVLRRLPPQLLHRFLRIERGVRRQDDARMREKRRVARDRLLGQ